MRIVHSIYIAVLLNCPALHTSFAGHLEPTNSTPDGFTKAELTLKFRIEAATPGIIIKLSDSAETTVAPPSSNGASPPHPASSADQLSTITETPITATKTMTDTTESRSGLRRKARSLHLTLKRSISRMWGTKKKTSIEAPKASK